MEAFRDVALNSEKYRFLDTLKPCNIIYEDSSNRGLNSIEKGSIEETFPFHDFAGESCASVLEVCFLIDGIQSSVCEAMRLETTKKQATNHCEESLEACMDATKRVARKCHIHNQKSCKMLNVLDRPYPDCQNR